jgi:hypothetical protein
MNAIEKYIEALELLKKQEINNKSDLTVWKAQAINTINRIYGEDSKQEKQIDNISYRSFSSVSVMAGHVSSGSRSDNLHSCKQECIKMIEGIIYDLKSFGLPKKNNSDSENKALNINITQNQSVKQKVSINIILEAIQDELSGKQLKELQRIIDENAEPSEKKKKLLNKLKEFGTDVASNILAGILTNPAIYGG